MRPFHLSLTLMATAGLGYGYIAPAFTNASADAAAFDAPALISNRLAGVDRALEPLLSASAVTGAVIQISPSTDGADSDHIDGALRQARLIRGSSGRGVTILFTPGTYHLIKPIQLTIADSGTSDSPFRLAGAPGGAVILTGTSVLAATALPSSLAKLVPAPVRDRIKTYHVQSDLAPSPPFPVRSTNSQPAGQTLIITQGGHELWRTQWPAQGYASQDVLAPQPGPQVSPDIALPSGIPVNLKGEPSLSAGGYWTYAWAYEERPVTISDNNPSHFRLGPLSTHYAESNRVRFRLMNAFGLLANPGEFAYSAGYLAVVPLSGGAPVESSRLNTLVTVSGAHDIIFNGLALRGSRGTALTVAHSSSVLFKNGYIGVTGGSGANISDSEHVIIDHSVIADVGETGVAISGPENTGHLAFNAVIDSVISGTGKLTRTYMPAIRLNGEGQIVRGNRISDLPHAAIIFNGQNHMIVGNDISHVCSETADAGAIYSFGSLVTRGTIISYNYFHDISTPSELLQDTWQKSGDAYIVRSVYLDSWTSGELVLDNLFERTTWSFWINSGENNRVEDNIFVDSGKSIGRIYDISRHWHDNLGVRIRQSAEDISSSLAQALQIRFNSSLFTYGRGAGNVVSGNILVNSGDVTVDPQLAPMQTTKPSLIETSMDSKLESRVADLQQGVNDKSGSSTRNNILSSLRYLDLSL